MNNAANFNTVYKNKLEAMKQKLNDSAQAKDNSGDHDEAIMDKIRLNVIHVFLSLFETCSGKVARGEMRTVPVFREIIDKHCDPEQRMFHAYCHFFSNIGGHWQSSLEQARKHNDVVNARKEEVKLEVLDRVRRSFLKTFHENWG